MENKHEHGIRTANCTECLRPFSVAIVDETLFNGLCVFCRIEQRTRDMQDELEDEID